MLRHESKLPGWALKDWDEYDIHGEEVTRRWYKLSWVDTSDGVIRKIAERLEEVVQEHLEVIAKRLAKESDRD
jgi:hypothetical protein